MNRRDFVRGAGLAAAAMAPGVGAGVTGGRVKVYLGYSQQELDAAYDDAAWAPNMRQLLADQAAAGVQVRASFPVRTLHYGLRPSEQLDVFAPRGSGADAGRPAMVFIHGGNWRVGSKESVSCLAPPFLAHGAVFIAPEFDSLPRQSLAGMVDQCRRAILWVRQHAGEIGVDAGRIYVGGHSAGGHLATMMLTTDWTGSGVPARLLQGGLIVSGLCDLEPVVMAAGNKHLKLSARERIQYSPVHKLHTVACPVIVAWGGKDSPEFRRQSLVMVQGLRAAGRLAGSIELPKVNHFEILDVLRNRHSPLAQATLALIG